MRPYKIGIISLLITFLLGCATAKKNPNPGNEDNLKMEAMQEQIRRMNTPQQEGSLWVEGFAGGLFSDIKASRVGDIITINIVEKAKASKKAGTKLERESKVKAGISNFFGLEKASGSSRFTPDKLLGSEFENKFDGEGATTRSDDLVATMTAFVTEVLPNGNMKIEGRRDVKVNNENQFIILSGVIRPEDISTNNVVLSYNIADAQIEYGGKGLISEKQRAGWMARILDWIWPF